MSSDDFWQTKQLQQLSRTEWESLCDGCGQCCLHKLEDDETGELYFTAVACNLLDLKTCRCSHYPERTTQVPDCLDLSAASFTQFHWLPPTCAYRLRAEGKPLPAWHPLITGDPESPRKAGMSAGPYAIHESQVQDLSEHIIHWRTECD